MPFIEANGTCVRYGLEGKPGAPVILFSDIEAGPQFTAAVREFLSATAIPAG